jgi:hypothetical protein
MPSATDAAEPLDEPPGVRARSANALEARRRHSLAHRLARPDGLHDLGGGQLVDRLASGTHSPRFVSCMSFCQR